MIKEIVRKHQVCVFVIGCIAFILGSLVLSESYHYIKGLPKEVTFNLQGVEIVGTKIDDKILEGSFSGTRTLGNKGDKVLDGILQIEDSRYDIRVSVSYHCNEHSELTNLVKENKFVGKAKVYPDFEKLYIYEVDSESQMVEDANRIFIFSSISVDIANEWAQKQVEVK